MNNYQIENAVLFTGTNMINDAVIQIANGRISWFGSRENLVELGSQFSERIDVRGRTVSAGFVDLQVNGGGGKLFNDEPSAATIQLIASAHARFGTTSILPTFITGSVEKCHWQPKPRYRQVTRIWLASEFTSKGRRSQQNG
jgi:N-acetylglucosamine-6-phosphate deacetylase